MKAKSLAVVLGLSAFLAGGSVFAQGSLVEVNISNVANDIARNLSVDVNRIPVTVQVPVDVAAVVCGVAANVLGTQQPSANPSCTATSTSTALNTIVQSQLTG